MSCPLRPEFEGALYHVTSRGDRREPVFENAAARSLAYYFKTAERDVAVARTHLEGGTYPDGHRADDWLIRVQNQPIDCQT